MDNSFRTQQIQNEIQAVSYALSQSQAELEGLLYTLTYNSGGFGYDDLNQLRNNIAYKKKEVKSLETQLNRLQATLMKPAPISQVKRELETQLRTGSMVMLEETPDRLKHAHQDGESGTILYLDGLTFEYANRNVTMYHCPMCQKLYGTIE